MTDEIHCPNPLFPIFSRRTNVLKISEISEKKDKLNWSERAIFFLFYYQQDIFPQFSKNKTG